METLLYKKKKFIYMRNLLIIMPYNFIHEIGRVIERYSQIIFAGIGISVGIGALIWGNYKCSQHLKYLEDSGKQLRKRLENYDYLSSKPSTGLKRLARQRASYRRFVMIGQMMKYPESYPQVTNEELTDLVNFTMLAEEQEFVSKLEPNIRSDERFQNLEKSLGIDNGSLLNNFDSYNTLSQKINEADFFGVREELREVTKQREDLLLDLIKWNKNDEQRRKFVGLLLYL